MVQKQDVRGEPSDERRAVVLLERIQSDVKTVLEGHSGLVERMGRLETQEDAHYQDLKRSIWEGFEKIWEEFEKMDKRFAQVDTRFVEVNTRLDAHEQAHADRG